MGTRQAARLSILITGSGSGLGLELGHQLLEMGFTIFAGFTKVGEIEKFQDSFEKRCLLKWRAAKSNEYFKARLLSRKGTFFFLLWHLTAAAVSLMSSFVESIIIILSIGFFNFLHIIILKTSGLYSNDQHILNGLTDIRIEKEALRYIREYLGARFFPLELDITNNFSVVVAKQQCERILSLKGLDGLYAVVNNAGVHQCGYFELLGNSIKDTNLSEPRVEQLWKDIFDVNVFGAVRVVREFLPLLRKFSNCNSRGDAKWSSFWVPKNCSRIITIGSILGRVEMPGHSAYCASKAALKSFMDVLRIELEESKVLTVLIEPGAISNTSFFNLTLSDEAIALQNEKLRNDNDLRNTYGGRKAVIARFFYRLRFWKKFGCSAKNICPVIQLALISEAPYASYSAGFDVFFWYFFAYLPVSCRVAVSRFVFLIIPERLLASLEALRLRFSRKNRSYIDTRLKK